MAPTNPFFSNRDSKTLFILSWMIAFTVLHSKDESKVPDAASSNMIRSSSCLASMEVELVAAMGSSEVSVNSMFSFFPYLGSTPMNKQLLSSLLHSLSRSPHSPVSKISEKSGSTLTGLEIVGHKSLLLFLFPPVVTKSGTLRTGIRELRTSTAVRNLNIIIIYCMCSSKFQILRRWEI